MEEKTTEGTEEQKEDSGVEETTTEDTASKGTEGEASTTEDTASTTSDESASE